MKHYVHNKKNNTSFDIVHLSGPKSNYTITESGGTLSYTGKDNKNKYDLTDIEKFYWSRGETLKSTWPIEYGPYSIKVMSLNNYNPLNDNSCVACYTFDTRTKYNVKKAVFFRKMIGYWGFFGELQFWNNNNVYDIKAYSTGALSARLELNGVVIGSASLTNRWDNAGYWDAYRIFKSSNNLTGSGTCDDKDQTLTITFDTPLIVDTITYCSVPTWDTNRTSQITTSLYDVNNTEIYKNIDTKSYLNTNIRTIPQTGGGKYDLTENSRHLPTTNFSINDVAIFNGTSNYLDIPYNLFTGQNFSLNLKFKANSVSANQVIISNTNENWQMIGLSSSYIMVRAGGGSSWTNSNKKITAGIWYDLTIVRSGSVFNTYLDGVLFYTMPYSDQGTYGLCLGADGYYKNTWFNGSIDNVRIFNRALNQLEVTTLFITK